MDNILVVRCFWRGLIIAHILEDIVDGIVEDAIRTDRRVIECICILITWGKRRLNKVVWKYLTSILREILILLNHRVVLGRNL